MIKYLGSKRTLVPVLGELLTLSDARSAVDLFTGTTRVAQEFKRRGVEVTAVDTARYSDVFARCYIATDATTVDKDDLRDAVRYLDGLPGRSGLLHRDVLCAVAVLPAVQRRAGRCRPPHARPRVRRQPTVPDPADQPDRRDGPGGLDDRPADGVHQGVGAPLVQPVDAAGAGAARRPGPRPSAATPGCSSTSCPTSTWPTSTPRTTSTATSRTTTSGRRWSPGMPRSTTASRASASTAGTRRPRVSST